MRISWKSVVNVVKDEIVPFFENEGVKPTLRTIFYALVSRNIIPNTRSSYQRLSKVLVEARKDNIFRWDFMEDKTRYAIKNFSDYRPTANELEWIEDVCKRKIEELDVNKIVDSMFNHLEINDRIGYWANQPIVPEIWIEKDALATTIGNWTYDLEINVRVNRGYSSWTFIYENVKELKQILDKHDKVVILYCGDLDPSGVDIQRFLNEALRYFGMDESKVELIRIAVTPEQVEEYNLPPKPEDAETLAKLQRDPRSKKYTYDYVVELDALVAYVPSDFKRILREEIEKYHDKEIYDKTKKEAEELRKKSIEIIENYKKKALERIREQVML